MKRNEPSNDRLAALNAIEGGGSAAADQAAIPTAEHKGPSMLILGGTGFLGRALIQRLLQNGVRPRALVRHLPGRAQALADQGVELAQGDLTDTASVEAALDGIQRGCRLARNVGFGGSNDMGSDIEPILRRLDPC